MFKKLNPGKCKLKKELKIGESLGIEEESRKRKRRTEETETEQRVEKVRNFISDKAIALMEKSLKDRGFIAERGFKKLISPFVEMLEKRE